jgi:type VI secretion system FHA domain protein
LSGPPIAAPAGGDGADKPGRDGKKEEPLRLDLLAVRSNAAPGPARATPPAPEQPGRVTPPSASAGLSAVDAYAVFLAGAGITAPAPADMAAALHDLGQAFRTVVSGLRQVIITRAAIKGEFRIEQTMIQSSGNNPLKFSADDDDALQALLGSRRLGDMPAERALDEAMRDLRTHEIAVSAAMQQATRDLLAALAPGCVERDLPGSPLDKLPGAGVRRKARSWNSYATLHARAMQALDDDFDSVFGKSFVRAYEQATADIDAQDGDGQHAAVPRRVK